MRAGLRLFKPKREHWLQPAFQQGGCRRCARCRYVIDGARIWNPRGNAPVDFLALGDFTAKAM